MKNWIIQLIVEFILKAISDDRIEDFAKTVKSYLIPLMQESKDELIRALMDKAAATDTKIDDAVYHALDVFLSEFIPAEEAFKEFAAKVS